jgi:hypothetical protein
MPQDASPEENRLGNIILVAYMLLAIAQSILALVLLASIPAESENAVLLGFSAERLTLMGIMLLLGLIFLGLLARGFIDRNWRLRITSGLKKWLNTRNNWGLVLLASLAGILGGVYFILLGLDITEPFTRSYFVRLQPFAIWTAGISAQTLIALPFLRYGTDLHWLKLKNKRIFSVALVFGLLLLLWAIIAVTRLGLVGESVGWYRLGAPVLETQAFLAWLIGLGFIGFGVFFARRSENIQWLKKLGQSILKPDLLIPLIIWLSATLIWSSIPLTPNWFVAEPGPPNFEYYPNSDASVYDITGQSALVGEGFKSWGTPFAVRPMYALFLDVLHKIRGLSYEPIISLQVAVLALFPVFIYWLATIMHSRVAGIIAATLITLREANSIKLAGVITVSNAKLLMSDLPAAFGIALVALTVIAWLQNPRRRQSFPLIAGGLIGLFMLIRPEIGVLLPFIGLVAAFRFHRRPISWTKNMVWLAIGVALLLSPWIWRNWQLTGKVFLDSPNYRADLIARRYNTEPDKTSIEQQPEESSEQFNQRLTADIVKFAQKNPDSIAHFVLSHYFNSQIQAVLMLPSSFRLIDSSIALLGHKSLPDFLQQCCSSESYVRRLPFWWQWDGKLPYESVVPLLLNLFLLAVGITVIWNLQKLIGLLPLIFSFAYFLINAAVRNSGGRYILPVDWSMIVYFSVGLAQLTIWGIGYFTEIKIPAFASEANVAAPSSEITSVEELRIDAFPTKAVSAIIVGFLIVGWSLPATEKLIPPRYNEALKQEKIAHIFDPNTKVLEEAQITLLQDFLNTNGVVVQGRALYPGFYAAGQGTPGDSWPTFIPRSYSRISFHLVGPYEQGIILASKEPPESLPNGSDVLVFGCPEEDYTEALAVVVYTSPIRVYFRSPLPESSCPFSSPG